MNTKDVIGRRIDKVVQERVSNKNHFIHGSTAPSEWELLELVLDNGSRIILMSVDTETAPMVTGRVVKADPGQAKKAVKALSTGDNKGDLVSVDPVYVDPEDRFIVSLVVGYSNGRDKVKTAEEAVLAALNLTRDDNSGDTLWNVYDRKTGRSELVMQSDAEASSND